MTAPLRQTPRVADAADGAHPCRHCGTRMEGDEPYCCEGCDMAAAILRDAGIDPLRLAEERAVPAPRPGPVPAGLDRLPVQVEADGMASCTLHVDGLRCASCVWVTERVLERTPGVRSAHVSYGSGRARVVFDPTEADIGDIASRVARLGYTPRPLTDGPSQADRALLLQLGVAAFCTMNLMLLSVSVYAGWASGMEARFVALFRWTGLALATPIVVYSARPFLDGAWVAVRHRLPAMDLPVALGIVLMYAHAIACTLTHRGEPYLDSLAMLVTLLLAGRLLEARGRKYAQEAAEALASVLPRTARVVTAAGVSTVDAGSLAVGDVLELGSGEEVAADGVVIGGDGAVRMALLTGESEPVPVVAGDRVVAGAVVVDGALRVSVTAVGGTTLLQQMAAELRSATDRGTTASMVDRIGPYFTVGTLAAAAATFAGWAATSGVTAAIPPTVAVLVVACPCALALAQPLAVASGLAAAARRGLLIRTGDALLRLAEVDAVGLDKTGTVTHGEPSVTSFDPAILRLTAGLCRQSVHPVSRAIVAAAGAAGLALPTGQNVREQVGRGLTGTVDGRSLRLRSGASGVSLWEGETWLGDIGLRDVPREDAPRAVAGLRRLGIEPVILTGDRAEVAQRIAEGCGVGWRGPLLPADKAAWVAEQQSQGRMVMFVGDGLNDGPALAAADVAIAMSGGSTASQLAADAVVSSDAIGPVVAGLAAARLTRRAIRGNILRSVAYNLLAVTAAAAGLVNPLVAAVLMPLSSSLVIFGAIRIERQLERTWTP
jgi:Cu2+-exporting ATPase